MRRNVKGPRADVSRKTGAGGAAIGLGALALVAAVLYVVGYFVVEGAQHEAKDYHEKATSGTAHAPAAYYQRRCLDACTRYGPGLWAYPWKRSSMDRWANEARLALARNHAMAGQTLAAACRARELVRIAPASKPGKEAQELLDWALERGVTQAQMDAAEDLAFTVLRMDQGMTGAGNQTRDYEIEAECQVTNRGRSAVKALSYLCVMDRYGLTAGGSVDALGPGERCVLKVKQKITSGDSVYVGPVDVVFVPLRVSVAGGAG